MDFLHQPPKTIVVQEQPPMGIRWQGKLVAMAGERLKVPGYTELSAVCTHPEHAGC